MTLSSHFAPITVGLSIALLSTASMADTTVTSNASIGNVQYQLVDLTPNDEFVPKLTFISSYNQSSTVIMDGFNSKVVSKDDSTHSLDPLSTLVASPQSQSFAGSNGGLFGGLSTKGYRQGDGFYQGIQSIDQNFSLSAHSAIVITGFVAGGTSTSDINNFNSFSFSNTTITLTQTTPADPNGTLDQRIGRDWSSPVGNSPSFENFSLTFSNNNAFAVEINYNAVVSSNGLVQSTTPVPEPETYAMMLSGLGMLAFLARRKAKQTAV